MKILLTGATGFIGVHLCRQLVANGHQVVALVRSKEKAKALPPAVEFIHGDLSIFSDPKLVLSECDTIIHLAGVVAGKNEQEYADMNYRSVGLSGGLHRTPILETGTIPFCIILGGRWSVPTLPCVHKYRNENTDDRKET